MNAVFKPLKVLFKVHGALFVGAVVSLAVLQEDPWLKMHLEHYIKESIESILEMPVTCALSKVDMWGGLITVVNIQAVSPQGSWSFSCPEATIRFSWLSWFKHREFETQLTFDKAALFSRYENKQWAIVDPFIKLIRAPTMIPLKFLSCMFGQAMINLERDDFRVSMLASSMSDILKDTVLTKIFLADGAIERNRILWAKDLTGTIQVDVPIEHTDNYALKMQVMADLPFVHKEPQQSLLVYAYGHGQGSWQWYPEDRSFVIKAEGLTFNPDDSLSMDTQIEGSLEKIVVYVPQASLGTLRNMQGILQGSAHVCIADGGNQLSYEGSGKIKDLAYEKIKIGPAAVTFKGNKQHVSGAIDLVQVQSVSTKNADAGLATRANWHCDFVTGACESTWMLSKNYGALAKIVIEKEETQARLTYKDGKLSGAYTIALTVDGKKHLVKGRIESDAVQMKLAGIFNAVPFSMTMKLDPYEVIHFSYANENGGKTEAKSGQKSTKGITFEKKDGALEGTVDFEYIKEALAHLFGFQPQGKAHVAIKAQMQTSPLQVDVLLSHASIKVPETHNFIKEAQASLTFDPEQRCLTVKNAKLQLQKGSISSGCATLLFSQAGSLAYAHVPCIAHDAFLSWNKDFYGNLSGAVTSEYTTGKKGPHWTCKGSLTLDKAQLRSNLLSSQVQKDLMRSSSALGKNIELDLQLSTRSPLTVKTFFFNTNAEINASVKGTVAQPQVAGLIELNKGSLLFPYKPLYVSLGKLQLTPNQPDDPAIELTAKNKIKKYTVTMRVAGTLHHPKISFESSPPLPEEQIITMLLTGSEDGPLYLAMPNMVMMQLENLLFGSGEHLSKAQQFFKTLLKPFKNIRFVPATDAEGKSIHGTIEVDFTDRLRAKAKNNLKLSEDTKFELEYSLSDDMTVKAIRDDAGSGGEVEMRWKF